MIGLNCLLLKLRLSLSVHIFFAYPGYFRFNGMHSSACFGIPFFIADVRVVGCFFRIRNFDYIIKRLYWKL